MGAKKRATQSTTLKYLAIAAALGTAGYLISEKDPLTPEAKQERYIVFQKEGFYTAFAGLPTGKIKITNVRVPMVEYAHYKTTELPTLQRKLDEIKQRYGKTILAAEAVTRVPFDLIVAMMFIESAGVEKAVSRAGAVGLMQILPDTATFIIAMENIKKRLSDYEKDWIREHLGRRLDEGILKMRDLGTPVKNSLGILANRFVSKEDLFDPDLNILVGAIYLGILLDESREADGSYRLDKLVVRYNMGYYAMGKGKKMAGAPNEVVTRMPGEPQAYIKKLVGKNGLLTLV
ncbi:transglycosylase SLT domain-containing protein [Pontibacter toksunensis]|uniref:Transglycosylase SLT domain-containing protein n=1 Tax=Pontibacter toksunensis TaxID=1332631 RepID=A0ABW6BYI9_9BACT